MYNMYVECAVMPVPVRVRFVARTRGRGSTSPPPASIAYRIQHKSWFRTFPMPSFALLQVNTNPGLVCSWSNAPKSGRHRIDRQHRFYWRFQSTLALTIAPKRGMNHSWQIGKRSGGYASASINVAYVVYQR